MLAYVSKSRYLTTDELLLNAKCIFDYLTNTMHWSPNAVCGLLGNTFVESKHNPGAWENNKVGNLSGGYGIVQWTPASKYLDWAKAMGYEATDMEGQLLRLKYEMDNGFQYYKTANYPSTFKQFIVSEESPDYLARAFVYNYERPSSPNVELRAQKALEYYRLFVTDVKEEVNNPLPDEDVKIVPWYQTRNFMYTKPKPQTVIGILMHSTGCNNKRISRYVGPDDGFLGENKYHNDWNNEDARKCMHGFLGELKDGTISFYNTLNWELKCAGCGSGSKGSYNSGYIQFEICEDGRNNKDYYDAVFEYAEKVCVYLCKLFNLTSENITSHDEAAKAGYASNHGDPSTWMRVFGDSMDKFRARVAARLGSQPIPEKPEKETDILFKGKYVVVNTKGAEGLNIWDSPAKKESKKKAAKGAVLFVLEDLENKWTTAVYDGVEGAVDGQFLVPATGAQIPPERYAKVDTKYDNGLNIWKDTNRKVSLKKIPEGTILNVKADLKDTWSVVEFEGIVGHVDKQYLPPYQPPVEDDDGGEDNPEITTEGMTITIVCHKQADVDSIIEFVSNIDD